MSGPVTSLLVETADLRRALRAVGPFVDKDAAPDSPFSRIRLVATPTVTYVHATSGVVAGCALVGTASLSHDGEALVGSQTAAFDLTKHDAAKILTCFPGRDGKDGEPGDELRLDIDDEHLVVVDASGLFEGQSLVLGRAPELEHPSNILRTFQHLATDPPAGPDNSLVTLLGPSVAIVLGASKVYDTQVVLEFHTRGDRIVTLARIGESFLGVLTEAHVDEDREAAQQSYRRDWAHRLEALDLRKGDDQ